MKIFNDLEVVAIPTKTNFRGVTVREAVIFKGSNHWSEFSPFLEYSDEESKPWLQAALSAAYNSWPNLIKKQIPINATLPNVSVERVPEILSKYPGAKTIKIKVDSFEKDADLVEAALDYNPEAKIRLDINGGWDLKNALLNLHDFHLRFGLVFEYIEQPCIELSDLGKLKAEIPMKIAVDESIRKSLDSDFSNLKEYADIAILKWQPIGGIEKAISLTKEIGLPVVISSALETGIGLSHGLALASALDVTSSCGLATATLLESDIVMEDLSIINGEIEVLSRTPNQGLIEKYRAPEDRKVWWLERIKRIIDSGGFDEFLN